MAKMFYSLEEAAKALDISQDQVKQMAEEGKLQQFRDRDRLMFKRDQVDAMKSGGATASPDDDLALTQKLDEPLPGVEDSPKKSAEETDAVDLMAETGKGIQTVESLKSATATGISVFDADEVEADPMAQTVQTPAARGQTEEEELTLDAEGSASGLLDLTREADDTSLGAVELLEDIAPGAGTGGAAASGAVAMDDGEAIGLADEPMATLEAAPEAAILPESGGEFGGMGEPGMGGGGGAYMVEEDDPTGDGLGGGILLGVFAILVVGLVMVVARLQGLVLKFPTAFLGGITDTNKQPDSNKLISYAVGMGVACLVLGLLGYFLGRMRLRKSVPVSL